jgi:hypothetical protein
MPFLAAFRVLTLITLSLYVFITAVLPVKANRNQSTLPLVVLIVATGLASYGLQFELERGQWNVIALTFALAAVWLFRRGGRQRILAYLLFSVSVQLKLWPLIFILMLVDDWDQWRRNLFRWTALALGNFLLLFLLGSRSFTVIGGYVVSQASTPRIGIHTHSIPTFVRFLQSVAVARGMDWTPLATRSIGIALYVLVIGCLLTIVLVAWRRHERGSNWHLLLACTVGACLLPPVSHDYKLAILAAPMALLLTQPRFSESAPNPVGRSLGLALTLFVLSCSYSSTLYSYATKPPALQNNAPALLIMLLAVVALYVWFPPEPADDDVPDFGSS